MVQRLTYEGHELLDAARSDTKAKATVMKNAGTLTLEALKATLAILMKHAATKIGSIARRPTT
jgi:hypothetical protein